MPEEYEKIKQSYLDKGKSKEEAERIAAATYNKNVRKHKKDKRPIGNKDQQKAGSAVSENDEDLLDAIVEFIDNTEPSIDLRSQKDIFFEEFIDQKLNAILEAYDVSTLTGSDAAGVFKAGFNGGQLGKRNPYPDGHVLAKIWGAGANAGREVDSAWVKTQQSKQSTSSPYSDLYHNEPKQSKLTKAQPNPNGPYSDAYHNEPKSSKSSLNGFSI